MATESFAQGVRQRRFECGGWVVPQVWDGLDLEFFPQAWGYRPSVEQEVERKGTYYKVRST